MTMTPSDLDNLYTALCRRLTELGEKQTPLYLARFALLAIEHIDNPDVVVNLIDAAGDGLPAPSPQA
ncbi:MAG: hypothetical protein JWQ73_1624 [Variovorax sp.]|jgi:hypothetical protein|nr:hypothetical protein [Variovorax sp.]